MYFLDTDVLIDIQRGHAPVIAWFASSSEIPSIPRFVVMELIQDAQNKQQVRKALQLVAPFPVIWPTETDCARAEKMRAIHQLLAAHSAHLARVALPAIFHLVHGQA